MPPLPYAIRHASSADSEAVLALVQSAYRGESSRQGWTTEAHLLDGQRTDREELESIVADPDARLLVALAHERIVGSVVLRRDGTVATLGMLAVSPELQGRGVGSQLLRFAERLAASELGVTTLELHVIELRTDVIAYYERRAYTLTGRHLPFPYGNARFGLPRTTQLRFVVLQKTLNPPLAANR
jgi:ribosomal protein S18 acetylase RimI-like enzyme